MLWRSSYSRSLLVVKRSTAMPRSSFLMPHPLSVICTTTRQRILGLQLDQRRATRTLLLPTCMTEARGTRSPGRGHLEHLEPAGLGDDGYVGRPRVDAVFQQLLERVGRPMDDLQGAHRQGARGHRSPAARLQHTSSSHRERTSDAAPPRTDE